MMENWYNLPLYYDVSFSHDMQAELEFLKKVIFLFSKKKNPKLLEPACGTGRLIVPLAREGYDCTGFDLNENALAYLSDKLSRRSLHAKLIKADLSNFDLPANHFDFAFCTVDTFRHLLSEKEAERHLQLITQTLKPGGFYILGLHLISKNGISEKVTRWTHKRGRLTVRSTMTLLEFNEKKRQEELQIKLNVSGVKTKKSFQSEYPLRTYTLKQLQSLVKRIPELGIENAYDENYSLKSPIKLNDKTEYAVLLIRKRHMK